MKKILTLVLVINFKFLLAQTDIYYGGCGHETGSDIIYNDSSIYLLGESKSFYWHNEIYILGFEKNGNNIFSKTFGLIGDISNTNKIIKYSSSTLIILYNNNSLLAIDVDGNFLWSKEYNNVSINDCIINKKKEIVLVGGFFNYSFDLVPWIMTTDSVGTPVNSKRYSVQSNDPITAEPSPFTGIIENVDSSYTLIGLNYFPDYSYCIKINNQLDLLWCKVYEKLCQQMSCINKLSNEGYIICGISSDTLEYHRQPLLMKIDNNGNLICYKTMKILNKPYYGGYPILAINRKVKVNKDLNDNFVFATNIEKDLFDKQTYLVFKFDSLLNILWTKEIADSNYLNLFGSITEIDKRYGVIGTSNSNVYGNNISPINLQNDIHVFYIDSLGNSNINNSIVTYQIQDNFVKSSNYPSNDSITNITYNQVVLNEENVIYTFSDSIDCIGVGIEKPVICNQQAIVYPNPNNGNFTIEFKELKDKPKTIEIFDLYGRIIYSKDSQFENSINIQLKSNIKGIILIKIASDEYYKLLKINCL